MNASEISRAIAAMDQARSHIAANRTYASQQESDLLLELKLSSCVLQRGLEKITVKVEVPQ